MEINCSIRRIVFRRQANRAGLLMDKASALINTQDLWKEKKNNNNKHTVGMSPSNTQPSIWALTRAYLHMIIVWTCEVHKDFQFEAFSLGPIKPDRFTEVSNISVWNPASSGENIR